MSNTHTAEEWSIPTADGGEVRVVRNGESDWEVSITGMTPDTSDTVLGALDHAAALVAAAFLDTRDRHLARRIGD